MRIIIFGDDKGVSQLIKYIPKQNIIAFVGAQNRPQYHEHLHLIASGLGIPLLLQPSRENYEYEKFRINILNLRPDLYFINSYSMILGQDLLDIPKHGGVNLHMSLLPKNRGANPIQWAIINGEIETGVTLHEVVETLDAGPVIAQETTSIFFEDSWFTVRERILKLSEILLSVTIPEIMQGVLKSTPQKNGLATLNPRRRPDDSEFTWNESIISIYNKIRALLPPMPAAFARNVCGTKEEFDQIRSPMSLTTLKFLHLNHGGGYMNGKKVRLRPIRIEDSPLLFEWINSRDVVILNSSFKPTSEFEHNEWMESILTQRDDLVIFAIEDLGAKKTIGTCKLININWKHRSAELQIRIGDKEYWGKGYGTESIELLCNFGYTDLNLNRIFLHVWESNKRAIATYKKVGFEVEGKMREAVFIDGKYENVVLMSILRG